VHFVPYLLKPFWLGDSATIFQLGFQDPATTTMEGIYLFNLHLLFVIISIVLLVAWILFLILKNFTELTNSKVADFTHSNIIEMCLQFELTRVFLGEMEKNIFY